MHIKTTKYRPNRIFRLDPKWGVIASQKFHILAQRTLDLAITAGALSESDFTEGVPA
jgi:hypothetical protein